MNKTKILIIIGFGIYLFLGILVPYLVILPFYAIKGFSIELAATYFTIGCFAHFGFRKFARKIGLINKEKKVWEGSITIFAFIYWLTNSFLILLKDYRMNS